MRHYTLLCLFTFIALNGCSSSRSDHATTLAAEASKDIGAGRYADALDKLTRATSIRPDVAEYQVTAGMAATKTRQIETATRHYRAAEQILAAQAASNPDRIDDLAIVVALNGRPDEAKDILQDAAMRYPDNREVRLLAESAESIFEELKEYSVASSVH